MYAGRGLPRSRGPESRSWTRAVLLGALLVLVLGAPVAASFVIDFQWWKEMNQIDTWLSMLGYGTLPFLAAVLLAASTLWVVHARALKKAGTGLSEHPTYARIATAVALFAGFIVAGATVDSWTVVRFFGGRGAADGWRDPVFAQPLSFYLFERPFYSALLGYVMTLAILSGIVYTLATSIWNILYRSEQFDFEISDLDLRPTAGFLRFAGAVFLLAMAARFYLARFGMLLNEHGFLVGVDYTDENFGLPLNWLAVGACAAAAVLVALGRFVLAGAMALLMVLQALVPTAVNAFYVRPNEISLQRPYILRHIEATRSAFGLSRRSREVEFPATPQARIDFAAQKTILENVRLWDWRAFHDTVTQIQALRPYYVFADSDVDRYVIDGRVRQVLLTPRELDIRQLPDARTRWINPHFIYTHGYGVVMADAARITSDGLPDLFIKDAPPQVLTPSLKITRPEIYFGEVMHEPVFVNTGQQEFSYPSGSDNVHTRYEGKGGFPVSSLALRFAAAVSQADWNILLTNLLRDGSRMMIRRRVAARLQALAGFITWDPDPYLVVTAEGRLVWMVDGYTTSNAHPYARGTRMEPVGSFNYIRNAVKATVDAYDGETRLYIFDPADPLIRAYQRLFPKLLLPAAEMPADIRSHTRYPEMLFRAQAELYRTYHMTDPDSFYNKEDVWDIARNVQGQDSRPVPMAPTYIVAALPGESKPEFLLMIPFTPRNKDNMIGMMVARCDGDRLGELVFLQLSKQALVFGPMQIEARINQDQNISKDLTLWNQQGSRVLRGHLLALPVEQTFLYLEPIYIQASEARMPQLKKVVLALGNDLIYEDTYDQALARLTGQTMALTAARQTMELAAPPAPAANRSTPGADSERLESIRNRLRRYRELAAQGKWAEAGKELEAIEAEVQRR